MPAVPLLQRVSAAGLAIGSAVVLATGSDYVTNICPMHVPYHLYEFTPASFERHGAGAGYGIAFREYYPCTAYAPRWLDPLFIRVMEWTRTGMQLAIWLETPRSEE